MLNIRQMMAYKSQHHEEQCEGAQGGDAPCVRPGLPPPLSSRTISADASSQLSERAGWESVWTAPPHFGEEGTRELSCRIKAMPHQSESDGRWSEVTAELRGWISVMSAVEPTFHAVATHHQALHHPSSTYRRKF